jgi:hypothetical protein
MAQVEDVPKGRHGPGGVPEKGEHGIFFREGLAPIPNVPSSQSNRSHG